MLYKYYPRHNDMEMADCKSIELNFQLDYLFIDLLNANIISDHDHTQIEYDAYPTKCDNIITSIHDLYFFIRSFDTTSKKEILRNFEALKHYLCKILSQIITDKETIDYKEFIESELISYYEHEKDLLELTQEYNTDCDHFFEFFIEQHLWLQNDFKNKNTLKNYLYSKLLEIKSKNLTQTKEGNDLIGVNNISYHIKSIYFCLKPLVQQLSLYTTLESGEVYSLSLQEIKNELEGVEQFIHELVHERINYPVIKKDNETITGAKALHYLQNSM